jgi:hypothetical protein
MAHELDVLLNRVEDPVLRADLKRQVDLRRVAFEGGKVTAVYESDAARDYR